MADEYIDPIIARLNARLELIDGLRVCDSWPEQITPPAAAVQLESIDFDTTMDRGSDDLTFVAHFWTARTVNRVGLSKLYGYISGRGTNSAKRVIEADPTLGGEAQFVHVTEARTPGFAKFGEITYFAGQLVIVVGVDGFGPDGL